MRAFFRFDVGGVGSQDYRDGIPTHLKDLAADVGSVLFESIVLAEIVAITGRWTVLLKEVLDIRFIVDIWLKLTPVMSHK